eukprot:g18260.t1
MTWQGWVLVYTLELLAVEAVGRVALADAASMSVVLLVSETEATVSAAVSMAFAVLEVVYPAADVTSSVGTLMAAGTLWARFW